MHICPSSLNGAKVSGESTDLNFETFVMQINACADDCYEQRELNNWLLSKLFITNVISNKFDSKMGSF